MPLIMRIGNLSSGHDSCAVVPAVEGSPTFDVNGFAVVRIGDAYQDHGCPMHPTHTPKQSQGSILLDADNIPVALVGHQIAQNVCPGSHVCQVGDDLVDVEC